MKDLEISDDRKKPWNPKWLVLISFFLSFLVAGIIAGFNYGRLGKPEKRKKVVAYTIFGFVSLLIITAMLHPLPEALYKGIVYGINVGVGVYLFRKQQIDYAKWKLSNEFTEKNEGSRQNG